MLTIVFVITSAVFLCLLIYVAVERDELRNWIGANSDLQKNAN